MNDKGKDKYAETRPITSRASSSASSDSYKTTPYQAAPIAPDGGWGWVVCASSFMCMVIMDGMLFTYGVFFVEFLDYFGSGKGETALVGSVFMGMSMFFGPFASTMVNLWGIRPVSIAGSFIAATSFACSVLAPNLEVLTFTYGVMGGIGVAMTYVCSILVVGFYFDKRRALANGITSSGSGMGTFIFSPLCTYLINEYSWKGAMLILSGITLNCAIFSALYRPLKPVRSVADIQDNNNKDDEEHLSTELNSKDPSYYETDEQKIPNTASGLPDIPLLHSDNISKSACDIDKGHRDNRQLNLSKFVLAKQLNHMLHSNQEITPKVEPSSFHTCHNIYTLSKPAEPFKLCHSSGNVHVYHREPYLTNYAPIKPKQVFLKPLDKKDIFYSGSLLKLASCDLQEKQNDIINDIDTESIDEDTGCCDLKRAKRSFLKMTGIHLLANPIFVLIVLSSVLWTTHSTILTILPHYSMQEGASTTNAATLLSVIGISNTVARTLVGWVSCRDGVNVVYLNISALFIGGFSCLLMPFIPNFTALVVLAVVFGCCMATWTSLRPILLVEFLGVNNLTNAFGLVAMFQGIAFSIGPPVAGILHDLTGSYKVPFILAGSAFITSGCVYLLTARIVSCINNKKRTLI